MRKLIISLSIVLAACTTPPTIEDRKDVVVLAEKEVVELLQSTDAPPLDLAKYKELQFKIFTLEGKNYIILTYDDYTKLIELLSVLNGHINVQRVTIDELQQFLQRSVDSKLDRQEVD